MLEFFRGWKRKVGCITLLVACAFVALGVRGRVVEDHFRPGSGKGRATHEFIFSRTGVAWLSESTTTGGYEWMPGWSTGDPELEHADQVAKLFNIEPKMNELIVWRWRWLGFDAGKTDQPEGPEDFNCQTKWLQIPYWMIVVPLSVLSSWLFLSKPRIKRQTPIPTAAEVP